MVVIMMLLAISLIVGQGNRVASTYATAEAVSILTEWTASPDGSRPGIDLSTPTPGGSVQQSPEQQAGAAGEALTSPPQHWHGPNSAEPYLDIGLSSSVAAVEGSPARLPCRILQLGSQTVSWIRKLDLHILTLGNHSFTSDVRFKVEQNTSSGDYTLLISSAHAQDAGVYECQVNTEPKLSWPVALSVEEARARIGGPPDLYIERDSSIRLQCQLPTPSGEPASLTWERDGVPLQLTSHIPMTSPRAGISLQTEKTRSETTSWLMVTRAQGADSGNYTCRPSLGTAASVRVHVIDDDLPAAMQTAGAAATAEGLQCRCLMSLLLLLLAGTGRPYR